MPAENRFWGRDVGQMLEHLPSENPAFDGQAPPLVVVEQDSALSELLSQNSILGKEVLDGVLLSAVDPAGEDQEQQMPRLKLRPHVSPGCVVEISSIGDRYAPSSVLSMSQPRHGKNHCLSNLHLG